MEKTLLIHRKVLVYYYYQFVYKLVYYNNKTDKAKSATRTSTLNTACQEKRLLTVLQKLPSTSSSRLQAACKTAFSLISAKPAVEKSMYIHRIGCAERSVYCVSQNLSTFRSTSTHALSCQKKRRQVFDTVE